MFLFHGKFFSNNGGADSPVHGEKRDDSHYWGPSFDNGDDNDSLWNFNRKVQLLSCFCATVSCL
mgnify:CR=1 FL=1